MRLRNIAVLISAPLLPVFSTTVSLHAQTSKGTLTGVARDQSGAVVTGAQVTVTNQGTSERRMVPTDSTGSYRIDAISPGTYTVVVSQAGFDTANVKNVIVNSSQVTSYDVTLSVGKQTTEVEVEANSTTVNTDNGTITGTVNAIQIDKLPIFSLNPFELATTLPGVQIVNQNGFSNGQNFQANGARPRANNALLDGQEINDVAISGQAFQPIIPDIFDSLNVITSSASAEYGRAGGAISNLVTKSGTNSFHGTAYERYTGSGLNALTASLRGDTSRSDKARYDTHTYGFTAGGPIFKDKLFAFGGLALQRYYGKQTPNAIALPNAAGYATLQTITGPEAAQVTLLDSYLSNGSYLTQYVLQSQLTPPASITLGAQPGCAAPCTVTENYYRRPNASTSSPETQFAFRIDYKPRDKDNFFYRYIHDRGSFSPDFGNNGSALAGFDTEQGGPSEVGEGAWTHVFGPRVLNELRGSETRVAFQFAPTAQTLANPLFALATISIAGFPALGPNQNFPQGRGEDLYQIQDTVRITKGRNSIAVGVDLGRQLEKDLVSQNAKGTLSFAAGGAGSALGNFLLNQLGTSGTATKTFGSTRIDPHLYRSGVFVEDDIKFNSDLTVNLGVRYDYITNPENSLQYPGIDPGNPYAAINTVFKVKNDTNNISPRIGFAYSPHSNEGPRFFNDGKLVIRGGFGIFYDSDFSNFVTNAAQSSPNAVAGTLTSTAVGGLQNATSLIPSITSTLNPLSSVTSVNNNLVNPQTYEYNLGVERELPGNLVASVRYVGARGEKLFANQQFNYFSGLTGLRLNPARGAIVSRGNYADSNYNSLQVELRHNFSHGLVIESNYQYGKDLDDGSEIFTLTGQNTSYGADLSVGGRRQEYGPSSYDHRHYFSLSYVYAPTGFHADNHFANALLGVFTHHFVLSGVEQLQSGAYSTISPYGSSQGGIDENGDGSTTNDRPIYGNIAAPFATYGIDGHYLKGGTTGVYYDGPSYYQPQVTGTNPNAVAQLIPVTGSQVHFLVPYSAQNAFLRQEIGRNSFENPGIIVTNIAVEKGIGLSYLHFERGSINLRAEVSNLANHNNQAINDTNLFDISTGPTSSFLSQKNARQGGRSMVLWAKFIF